MASSSWASWTRAGIDTWSLGLEASGVIALRLTRMAQGGAAASDEAQLMLSEKIASAAELQADLLGGRFGATPLTGTQHVLRHYTRKVKANRKRLR